MYVVLYGILIQYIRSARTAADRMCAVARCNNISSKADCGYISIRAKWVPYKQECIVPPPSNIMEVKKTPTIWGQNIIKI